MSKINLSDVTNITGAETTAINTINVNSQTIETAFDNTLSRDGTSPNPMLADLDMNSNDLLNVGDIEATTMTLGGIAISGIGSLSTKGDTGWAPILSVANDSARRVFQLTDYAGGTGTKPVANIGQYVTAAGYTSVIASGIDIRGPSGAGTGDMLAANNLSDVANKPTSFTNIKQAATAGATGVVQLSTFAQAIAGTAGLVATTDIIKQIVDMVCPVGTVDHFMGTTAPTYWLEVNGGSIGSSLSGGTTRANDDTINLYTLIWANTNIVIQTSGGVPDVRGISAAADFSANKRLVFPETRGRFIRGWDNGLGYDAGRSALSFQDHALQNHTQTGTTDSQGNHTHTVSADAVVHGANGLGTALFKAGDGDQTNASSHPSMTTTTSGAHTHTATISTITVGNSAAETRPANVSFMTIVRY